MHGFNELIASLKANKCFNSLDLKKEKENKFHNGQI